MAVPRFFFWQGKLLWVSCITMLSKIAGFVNGILCKYFIFTRDAEGVVPYDGESEATTLLLLPALRGRCKRPYGRG